MKNFQFNDGGQSEYRSLNSGYCGVRALVMATGMNWKDAEKHLRKFTKAGRAGNGKLSNGIFREDYSAALAALGWKWTPTKPLIVPQGYKQPRAKDLQGKGKVIARMAKHFAYVDDGVVHDIWDCTDKMVYGYWAKVA